MSSCARLDPAGFVRKSCPCGQLLRCICYWLCLGIREELATCSRYVCHLAFHFYHWCCHEQIRIQVYAVSFNPLKRSCYLANSFNQALAQTRR